MTVSRVFHTDDILENVQEEEEEEEVDIDIFESSSDEEDNNCECDNCRAGESEDEECSTLCEEKVRRKSFTFIYLIIINFKSK